MLDRLFAEHNSHRKRGETDRPRLRSTAPALDPTGNEKSPGRLSDPGSREVCSLVAAHAFHTRHATGRAANGLLVFLLGQLREALLHGPEQIADLPVPVVESPGAVRIGHPERGHLVEYLAPNSVFNSLPRQRSCPHLGPDDRFVTIDRVLHHASLGAA